MTNITMFSSVFVVCVFLYCSQAYFALGNVVHWMPDSTFSLSSNYFKGETPCDVNKVIFPENVLPIQIKDSHEVAEVDLPLDGELIFAEGASLSFGEKPANSSCQHYGSHTIMVTKPSLRWDSFDVWNNSKFNEATPDIDRRPCFDDMVYFKEGTEFSIQLPDLIQYVSGINYKGRYFSQAEFDLYVMTSMEQSQTFVLNKYLETGVIIKSDYCQARAGCPCQKYADLECSERSCDIPQCSNPIKPTGHCCEICGGVLFYEIDKTLFDLKDFEDMVARTVAENGESDKVVYYISRFEPSSLQVIFVDKGQFEAASMTIASAVDYKFKSHWLQGKKAMYLSGPPSGKEAITLRVVFLTLLVVLVVLVSTYVWFYGVPTNRYQTPDVFVRLYNRSNSVVSITRPDETSSVNAFGNPLYDSMRRNENVAVARTGSPVSRQPPVPESLLQSAAVARMSELLAKE